MCLNKYMKHTSSSVKSGHMVENGNIQKRNGKKKKPKLIIRQGTRIWARIIGFFFSNQVPKKDSLRFWIMTVFYRKLLPSECLARGWRVWNKGSNVNDTSPEICRNQCQ